MIGALDERLYALQDGNWNVTSIADSSGAIQERCAYAAYGAPSLLTASFGAQSASAKAWDVLYAGCRRDVATGLIGARSRYCHPLLGEWLSRDPMVGMRNLYEYVDSQPLGMTDPWGLEGIGHHYFPRAVATDLFGKGKMTKGAFDYAFGHWTGPTNTPHGSGRNGGITHKQYNKEVETVFTQYMDHNNLERMNQKDMEKFIEEHLVQGKQVGSDKVNDKIKDFNKAIEKR